ELKVTTDKDDKVSPAVTTPLKNGLAITVQRIVKKKMTKTEAVKHATTTKKDASLYEGTRKVLTEGRNGSKAVTFERTLVDGKASGDKVLSSKVTKTAVTEVVAVGTKAKPAART